MRRRLAAGRQADRHRMIGGSHERRDGPECICGQAWDLWNQRCASDTSVHHPSCRTCGGYEDLSKDCPDCATSRANNDRPDTVKS